MDDTVNRLAKELAQAIAAAVQSDANVEACRARARAAGYELHLAIDAEVGFANRTRSGALVEVAAGRQRPAGDLGPQVAALRELTASDRLFLKSLRIAPDEIPEVKS